MCGSMAWPGALWVGGFREVTELTGAGRGPGPPTCFGPDSLPGSGPMPGTASRIGSGPQPPACAPAPTPAHSWSLSTSSFLNSGGWPEATEH